jgi:hypothetical protein
VIGEISHKITVTSPELGPVQSKTILVNAPRATFIDLIFTPEKARIEGGTWEHEEGRKLAAQKISLQYGKGNPPDYGLGPIRPLLTINWLEGKFTNETNVPQEVRLALSRTFDAFKLVFEFQEYQWAPRFDYRIELPVKLEAEWGCEEDIGSTGPTVGTF